jgi:hypothetical protein
LKEIQEAIDDNCTGSLIALLGADGSIPLHRAVEMLHLPAVKALVSVTDVNALDKFQRSALEACAQQILAKQTSPFHLAQVAAPSPLNLFDGGPAPNRSGLLFNAGTLGQNAADPIDVAKALLRAGAHPRSSLFAAAQCSSAEFGLMLLGAGADARDQDAQSRSPLWFAVQHCPELVEHLLVAGANPRCGPDGYLPADVAATAATRALLHRAVRWYDIRLFIWAYSRGQVGGAVDADELDADETHRRRPLRMLGDVLEGVVSKVLPFLTADDATNFE